MRGTASASPDADVVLYDHLVHPRLLRHARPDAEKIDVGARRAAAARTGSHLLPARREGARRQDRRAAEMGRPVRLRSRRRRSAVPARAGRPLRSRARRSGRHRRSPAMPASRSPIPAAATRSTFVRGHEDEGKARAVGRLGEPGAARRHDRLLRRARPAAAHPRRRSSRTAAGRGFRGAVIYDGTLPTQETRRRHARRDLHAGRSVERPAAGDPRRRARRRRCASTCAGSTRGRCSASASW